VGPPSTKIFCPVIFPPTGIGDDGKLDASEVPSAAGVRARRAPARPLERMRDSNPRHLGSPRFEESGVVAVAVDTRTGQVCMVNAWMIY
jgi:hypothetical protein